MNSVQSMSGAVNLFPHSGCRGCGGNDESHFHTLADHLHFGIVVATRGGTVLFANRAAQELFQRTATEMAGYPFNFPLVEGETMEIEIPQRDGEKLAVEMQVSRFEWEGGEPAYAVSLHNIALYRKLKTSLQKSSDRLRAIINASPVAIITLDGDLRVMLWSMVAERLFGWNERELIGQPLPILSENGEDDLQQYCRCGLQNMAFFGIELPPQLRRDGAPVDVSIWVAPLTDSRSLAGGVLLVVADISARKQAEAQIQYLSSRNALTGLPNRASFIDILDTSIAHGIQRAGSSMAVFYLGLDRFKNVNESLGYGGGDSLLLKVAEILGQIIRDGDVLSHVGGDEFALLMQDFGNPHDVIRAAKKLLRALSEPVSLDGGMEVLVSVSMGVAVFPGDGLQGEELLHKAETAMRRAKENGGKQFQFFSSGMNSCSVERLTLESSLRHALTREEFLLHFQPQMEIGGGQVIGAEALVRWNHPELGELSPGRFIGLAEECGLIVDLGEWVLRQACRQSVEWARAGWGRVPVAVNVSPLQFSRKLHRTVAHILQETGLDPALLDVELTEGTVMRDAEAATAELRRLKNMGVRISIDDFGMGYSSLSYLKRFPIDKLKIDQSFVRDIPGDPDDAAIITAIVGLAKSLNLKVIAEGVETAAQLEFLRDLRCDQVQGYYCGRPMAADRLAALLEEGGVCRKVLSGTV